jgi:hypothetical protein
MWRSLLSKFSKTAKIMMNCVNVWCFLLQFPDAPRPYTRPYLSQHSGSIREQLKASWLTAVIGCVLFFAAMRLLFWNEVRIMYMKTCFIKVQFEVTNVMMHLIKHHVMKVYGGVEV